MCAAFFSPIYLLNFSTDGISIRPQLLNKPSCELSTGTFQPNETKRERKRKRAKKCELFVFTTSLNSHRIFFVFFFITIIVYFVCVCVLLINFLQHSDFFFFFFWERRFIWFPSLRPNIGIEFHWFNATIWLNYHVRIHSINFCLNTSLEKDHHSLNGVEIPSTKFLIQLIVAFHRMQTYFDLYCA